MVGGKDVCEDAEVMEQILGYILKSALCNLHMALNIETSTFLSYFIFDD